MTYSINRQEAEKLAEKLGISVSFDSEKPGILELSSGIIYESTDFIMEKMDNTFFKHVKTVSDEELIVRQPSKESIVIQYENKKNPFKFNQLDYGEYCA